MKTLAAAATLALAAGAACAQTEPPPPVTIENSAEIRLASQIAGRELRLMVYRPAGDAPEQGFPVLYAFDGDLNFGLLADIADGLAWNARRVGLAPAMVVGIGYADGKLDMLRRAYDLTPPREVYNMPLRPNGKPWGAFGGGEIFLDALEREVKPLIAERYKVNADAETLYGHSFGALLTLHAMISHPERFERYVAASPSIWFNKGDMLERIETFLKARPTDAAPIPLRVTVGAAEHSLSAWDALDPDRLEMRRKWLETNNMLGYARDLKALIDAHPEAGLSFSYEEFPGLDHGGAGVAAAYGAVTMAIFPESLAAQ